MTPSETFRLSAATLNFWAARSSRIARTSAPACRNAVPLASTERLPAVWPSFGVRPVSPEMIRTRASGRSSSSAAICDKAVRMPCPSSTLPVKTVAVPSALIASQALSMRLVLQAAREPRRLLRQSQRRQAEGQRDTAKPGGEVAARQMGSIHDQILPFAWAARRTARTMRLWLPQRQRLAASPSRTCASVGRGLRSSNAFAAMIMPLVQ